MMALHPRLAALFVLWCLALAVAEAQTPATRPASPLTVITATGRKPLATVLAGDHEMVALDDLAALFGLAVRDEPTAGGVTVACNGKTIALTPGQSVASVAGRLVSLPAPVGREGRRWLVPIEFISRALAPLHDARIDLRMASRLVIVGNLRVPRVVASIEAVGAGARVTFEVTPRTVHAVTPEPGRLLVRFESDALDVSLPAAVPAGSAQVVHVVDPANLIAVELGPHGGTYRASAQPSESGGERLIIDLLASPAEQSPLAQAAVPPPPAVPPGIAAGSGQVTMVLDPGHGGNETGARGPGGVLEKDVTLAVARQLKSAIEGRLGIRVLLTRDGDVAVPLEDRTSLANNNKAEIFLSLHANASLRPAARGAVAYFLSAEASGEARQAPGRQIVPALGGGSREIDVILWDMAQTRFLAESAAFAEMIGQELQSRVAVGQRRIEQAPFRVLVGANMPAVLVEVGFLSNPEQERQLSSPAYQSLLVQGLLEAISRFRTYLDQSRQPTDPAGPPPAIAGRWTP
ncbi:MAG: N-acetylmuramoyl-L-alanine amidase [Acidobacteria bacterium]|nr:N-acetylmuramoyl-L-alanine amidase [Acidobacteriota bacterium]